MPTYAQQRDALLHSPHSQVQVLPARRCSVYLLFWYKRTNTDAARRPTGETIAEVGMRYSVDWLQVLTLLALLVQKYKY
jgi:hypothetical protein